MNNLKGVFTAIVTPFTKERKLDEEALVRLVHLQVEAGVDGIVPIGSTGEAPTLTKQEIKRIVTITKSEIKENSCLLIVGTGSYSTTQAIENTQQAQELGADAALVVTPYYNRPSQEGLFQHFKAIAEATSIPLILYNVPGRCGVNIQTDTLKRLIEIPSIIGVKEASGSIQQIGEVIGMVRSMRPNFSVLSGDDALTLPLMSLGGDGIISVVSNLLPKKIKELYNAAANGNYALAQQLNLQLMPMFKAAFIDTNPIPIKAAMAMCGLIQLAYRLPLCELSHDHAAKLAQVVQQYRDIASPAFL